MDKGREEKEAVLNMLMRYQKEVKDTHQWRQLEALWLREKLRKKGKEVAEILHYRVQTVHYLWHRWLREGEGMLRDRQGPGGRKHAYLTEEEEGEVLQSCIKKAQRGNIVTVQDIKKAYEDRSGKHVHVSTIYRCLRRHEWRKVVPGKRHPKSDPATQEDSKKNS